MSQYDAFYTSKAYCNTFLRKSLCIGDLFVFSTINFFLRFGEKRHWIFAEVIILSAFLQVAYNYDYCSVILFGYPLQCKSASLSFINACSITLVIVTR